MNCVIGIDVGTSGCKVIAVAADGRILSESTETYPLYQPQPGWTEQEPDDWWEGAVRGLRTVTAGLGGATIVGVSFSGQMHGMVALDKEKRPVRRAILWNDQRTQKQCDQITEAAGGLPGLLTYTNNMMLTGYTGGKILWMKENEPENYEKTETVILPKDYIRYRLTGELVTEVSDASGTGLYDVKNRCWAKGLIEKVGLHESLFPACVESTEQTGCVAEAAAAETGIPAGVPVYGGGGDAVISTTGMGLAVPGRVGVTLGTSGVVASGLPGYADNPEGRLQLFCGNAPGRWMAFGCTLAAAGSYQWFHDALGGGDSFRDLDRLAGEVPAGSGGLLYLPYLTGERCPLFDPEAKGAFLGLSSVMGKGHFARAVLEGVCFSLKHVYDRIADASPTIVSNEIVVAGGGAKSPLWRQMLADIFQLPVRTVYGSALGGSFGAALVAGAGCGLWQDLEEAMKLAKPDGETLPIPENAGVYRAQYEKYLQMYPALKWSF
ncbi:MAG: xylulokinase [Provencibacterium sp.]|jgi:xylulokinase|nr:xylulokinase [Provencibacterium sp.]